MSQLEELSREECLTRLKEHRVGRVAFVAADSVPMILPVNYRVVETAERTWIALRTREGNVLDRGEMFVAFEIDQANYLQREGWSVVVRGTLHHIDSEVQAFRERFDSAPWVLEDREAWLIIDPFAITGRRLHAPDREWAFEKGAYL